MGIFDSFFKSDTKDSNWPGQQLESEEQLDALISTSFKTPQLIFKHSTRCSISRFVLADFIAHFSYSENEFGAHYLDLLNQRAISNAIAERFEVQHHSPQLIIIKNGKAVASASHEGINDLQLSDFL
mgnify:FL=1|jgi:bacillithiol system protein YtxJ